MFEKVAGADFLRGEHEVLRFWQGAEIFKKLRAKNAGKPRWSFLDGPITANNPMGVHHAWGRTYKDAYQRFFAMTGHDLRYQNGFDCQGLWVEVEVEREMQLTTKPAIEDFGIDKFVNACKRRVLQFAARQTEQSIRLGYWMDWDDPDALRKLARHVGTDESVTITTPSGKTVTDQSHRLVARLGCAEWGGSYFTFSTENNETIWAFLKKCHERGKIYSGHDVMPWSGQAGSAYSQMEVADGRRLTTHRSCFVRFPLADAENEFLLVWTTTPWTLTSNVACAVNPDLDYVKIRTTRDNAVYYFAKDNLNFQRLEREFKEGFGRPEWDWPKSTPKLKTIAQIFKEQGGFETFEAIKGSSLIGRPYQGPFDDLPAQSVSGGLPFKEALAGKTGVNCHRVIDGGRDSKGSPNVVAGEGTGIVHIAPGCGDIDYLLGEQHGLVSIAPLDEAGHFVAGFGPFTGKDATDPQTVQLVFDTLKAKHRLVTVEEYPHIYPFCWRTGVELVFRLVDEWFINMDWREEIKEVTRQIRWLPPSINGQEREVEWLSNMRDWMISKKRFWGLALPFWVDEVTGEFEVIGSLAELKARAVEGWNNFEGHTPHRPWIDRVKIRNPKTGNLMSRVRDVGNPWLDAGIVPFSTLQYNTNRDEWRKWYPPDLVLECFPGQFRNWFYSLLSMGTMMDGSPPFQTLFGHRLVMNEEGKPMHKSDGTAIWFEEAAEQLGVDTIRWMYLAQNPAADLRFGTRHRERPVTLQTPEGAIDQTKEGAPTCEVVSKPADEIRRQVLIPLWNSYAFFVNYARLDDFDPRAPLVPVAERPEIDRWLLSNLQALAATAHREFAEFNAQEVSRAAAGFIDDLSNWYIRRNRRRFWRSRDAGDRDKLAAYQTLYHTLLELSKLLAPLIPFLTERMYGNLHVDGPESVHLCDYPAADETLLDPELNRRMAAVQRLVGLGHKLRDDANVRVRQPLAEVRFASTDPSQAEAIEHLAEVVKEELNVKRLTRVDNLDGLARYTFKPNLKTLGPKYGKLLGGIGKALSTTDPSVLAPLRRGENVTLQVAGTDVILMPEDVLVATENTPGWVSAAEGTLQLALSTELGPELIREGMARDFVRHIQQLRKDADLEIEDRIAIYYQAGEPLVTTTLTEWAAYIVSETQADELKAADTAPAAAKSAMIGETKLLVWIVKK
jgi:isoleucyl-tRNA synthetase